MKKLTSVRQAFIVLSVLMFFFSAQVSLTIYIDSSFLKNAIESSSFLSQTGFWNNSEHTVGVLYAIASLLTIFALLAAPRILRKMGNYRSTLTLLILHILLLLGLTISESAILIIPLFIVEAALISVLYFNFDVFLERYSSDANTGAIRGLFLVINSIAWLLPPLLAGMIVDRFGFHLVYLTGAMIVCPTIFIIVRYFSDFHDLNYNDVPLLLSAKESADHPSIGHILASNFFLQFFFAWMVIYVPLYLHNEVGISFRDIGLLFTIALSAFIILPYFSGLLADRVFGEKEMLVGGFFLMGTSALFIPHLANIGVGLVVWAILLFIGRVGAAIVETMTETYFFKMIDGKNAGLMGQFRRSRPLAYIIAPISATLLLEFNVTTLGNMFYVLGAIMLLAIYFPLQIKDTK